MIDQFYTLHLANGDSSWEKYCEDFDTEADAHTQAGQMYGGLVDYRVVRVDHTVVAEVRR
jgi:hypothetical protein